MMRKRGRGHQKAELLEHVDGEVISEQKRRV